MLTRVSQYIQDNCFGIWLANAQDWHISHNQYWKTPILLFKYNMRLTDNFEVVCISSVTELECLSGVTGITDIHREKIVHITPKFFLSEGIDQTCSWFYTLLVLLMHLFGGAPWKNLIVTGLVLTVDRKKMSKSLKNYPKPNLIIDKYSADATRMFLVNSPIVWDDNLHIHEEGICEVISHILLLWLNLFHFFLKHVALLKKTSNVDFIYNSKAPLLFNIMDCWILAHCTEAQYATNTDSDIVILLDIQIHTNLQSEWLAHELTNHMQKLHKKAGLQATDDIDIYYQFKNGMGAELVPAIRQHKGIIWKTVGSMPVDIKVKKTGGTELISEKQEVAEIKFMLYLVCP
ncbi:Isoleucine--tRNA ligase, cytoplasmic [Leucoagaricus sp. SymC.cos]|nr:Isoleucine--tRNA ligase, cytoplasmic [Leucoagaricus sp. SymC.cos]